MRPSSISTSLLAVLVVTPALLLVDRAAADEVVFEEQIEGRAPDPDCGELGESCCLDFSCNSPELACFSSSEVPGTECVLCGDEDETCCDGGRCNMEELECIGDLQDVPAICIACGELFKPVCSRDGAEPCKDGLIAVAGRCQEDIAPAPVPMSDCGELGDECCKSPEGQFCNDPDVTCSLNPFTPDGFCVECGDEGEECCTGGSCNGMLVCFDDPLIADENAACFACGEEGQPLCTEDGKPKCVGDLVEVNGRCEQPSADDCCPDEQSCCSGACVPTDSLPFRSCLIGATCEGNCEGTCGCDEPPTPGPIKDCCEKGTSCCGDGCIPTEDLPFTLCPVSAKCGCDDTPPLEPVEDCCEEGTSCCGDGCVPTEDLPFTLCPVAGDCGCGALPPADDCCPEEKACCGDRCIPIDDLPFTTCPINGGTCGC